MNYNYMTEEEAKKKWCPEARLIMASSNTEAPINAAAGYNQSSLHEGNAMLKSAACLGANCMMWQWATEPLKERNELRLGFCGLAMRREV